jgi:maltooligosyltrehalose trehalohydrolase
MYSEDTRAQTKIERRLPVGAEVLPDGRVHFRVWTPQHEKVEVVLERCTGPDSEPLSFELAPELNWYFSGIVPEAEDGALYRFRMDDDKNLYPDPASRFQPEGPSGPSQVVDPQKFAWTDRNWAGISMDNQVMYEMHIGTYTAEGNWESALRQLEPLAELGITVIELMPVAEFAGTFGWGYDGVDLFAPSHLYGSLNDFRSFVDKAHSLGIGVILDVVYNHLGPVDNYLRQFSDSYFTSSYKNEWGEAINFDGPDSEPIREFFTANAAFWISEYHLDGLRIDATQQMYDKSPENILVSLARAARQAAGKRKIIIVAENERQQAKLVHSPEQGGYGLDGVWNDDFHHCALVAMTAHNEAYYSGYLGTPQELISSLKQGYLYQGQFFKWQNNRRGSPVYGIKPSAFVIYLQNHDQVANSGHGFRLQSVTSPGLYRALTALLLLAPQTPLLFQGQEFGASSPFLYFANVAPELAETIHRSRIKFLSQFRSLTRPKMQEYFARPDDPQTFAVSKLDLSERDRHTRAYAIHRDLLKLRRSDPIFHAQRVGGADGAVIGAHALVMRFFGEKGDDRLLLLNLGLDLSLEPISEPLLAPPENKFWQMAWSSEDPQYGGSGTAPFEPLDTWRIPGQAAIVLRPEHE